MTREELETALLGLSGREFEHFIGDLWEERGWDTRVTPQSGDDAVDIVAERDDYYLQKQLIQTKRKKKDVRVSRNTVQQYSYLHHKDGVDEVLLITTGTFTAGARESARTANVKLVDRHTLLDIVVDTAAENKLKEIGFEIETVESNENESEQLDWIEPDDVPKPGVDEIRAYTDSKDVYARLLTGLGLESLSLQSRLGVLLQLFRGPDTLHVLQLTQPADGIPDLCSRALQFAHPTTSVDCSRVDQDALIGRYSSTGEIFPGILREYSDGVIRFKQLSAYENADRVLAEPMEENTLTVSTGSFHESFETSFSALATLRPSQEYRSLYEPLGQIPINPRLLSAFDFVGFGNTSNPEFTLPPGFTPHDADVPKVTETRLQQHIALTKESNPSLTTDAETLLDKIHSTACQQIEMNYELAPAHGIRESLLTLARASARVRLSKKVQPFDVEIAAVGIPDFLTREAAGEIVETVKQTDEETETSEGSESTEEVVVTGATKEKRDCVENIKQIISNLEDEVGEGAPIEDVIDRAENTLGLDHSKAEDEIEKLRRKGETYEPQQGHLRTT